MKVRANKFYVYIPCILDQVDGRTDLKSGDIVQVRNMHGCPPCNTMRHAHVFDDAGKFAGLVATSSLVAPVYKNVAYFPDKESADALQARLIDKHPQARVVSYTRGFAVQYRISGPYYPELENVASPMLRDLIDQGIGATDAPATCPTATACNPFDLANSGRPDRCAVEVTTETRDGIIARRITSLPNSTPGVFRGARTKLMNRELRGDIYRVEVTRLDDPGRAYQFNY